MGWVKAIDKYSDDVQLCRVVGSIKQFPAMFAPHVICDFSGKTYEKEDIEWFDILEPSFIMNDMKLAYDSGLVYGSFENFMKQEYNIDITNG